MFREVAWALAEMWRLSVGTHGGGLSGRPSDLSFRCLSALVSVVFTISSWVMLSSGCCWMYSRIASLNMSKQKQSYHAEKCKISIKHFTASRSTTIYRSSSRATQGGASSIAFYSTPTAPSPYSLCGINTWRQKTHNPCPLSSSSPRTASSAPETWWSTSVSSCRTAASTVCQDCPWCLWWLPVVMQRKSVRVHSETVFHAPLMFRPTSGCDLRKAFFSWLYHSCWGVLGFSGTFEPFLVILSTRSGCSSLHKHTGNQHFSTIIILLRAADACRVFQVLRTHLT